MCFRWLAPARGEVVRADLATVQFLGAFTKSRAIPAEVAFGTPLAARPEFFDSSGHQQSSRTAAEGVRGLDKQRFERVGQFHRGTSSTAESGAHDTRRGMV